MAAVSVGMIAACSSTIEPVTDKARLGELGFLQTGVTTSKEVAARLGSPLNTYEGGRINTYQLQKIKGGYEATGDQKAVYHLILVYRPDGVLERWSLVYSGL